jgi:hypothetical protein
MGLVLVMIIRVVITGNNLGMTLEVCGQKTPNDDDSEKKSGDDRGCSLRLK